MSEGQAVDTTVIGGGVIGLAVAHALGERGQRVTVLESHTRGERGAAGVAAGMIAPVSEVDVSHPDLTRLSLVSHDEYPEWVARVEAASGLETGFDQSGTLWLSAHRDHIGWIEHLRGFQVDRGLDTERLTQAEVRAREPWISPSVTGGLLANDDWQVDPRRLMFALAGAIEAQAGRIIERARATAIERTGGRWRVAIDGATEGPAEVVSDRVVISPGAFGADLLETVLPGTGLRPVKGQVLRLRGPAGAEAIARHVIRTPDIYLVPRSDGEIVVGATMEEMGFDTRVTAGAVHDLIREAWRVLPGVAELELVETRTGFRPALRDHLPAIGAIEDGLFIAAGHYRNGVAVAPVTARLLTALIVDGEYDPALKPFDPRRFQAVVAPGETAR